MMMVIIAMNENFRLGNFDSDIVHHHHHRIIESSNHQRLMIYWLFRKKISIINKTRVQNIFANKKKRSSFFFFSFHNSFTKIIFFGIHQSKISFFDDGGFHYSRLWISVNFLFVFFFSPLLPLSIFIFDDEYILSFRCQGDDDDDE